MHHCFDPLGCKSMQKTCNSAKHAPQQRIQSRSSIIQLSVHINWCLLRSRSAIQMINDTNVAIARDLLNLIVNWFQSIAYRRVVGAVNLAERRRRKSINFSSVLPLIGAPHSDGFPPECSQCFPFHRTQRSFWFIDKLLQRMFPSAIKSVLNQMLPFLCCWFSLAISNSPHMQWKSFSVLAAIEIAL